MKITAIIPARYASVRFPGKLLADLNGKPVLQHVFERVSMATQVDQVIIATDHKEIKKVAEAFGARVVMTAETILSGTDRCAAVAKVLKEPGELIINVQGDEPLIAPKLVDDIAAYLEQGDAPVVTPIRRMHDQRMLFSPDEVKVVVDKDGKALYFSRQALPYMRHAPNEEWLNNHTYFQHIGMYGFRMETLLEIAALPPSLLEKAETLEQLRWLENGIPIQTFRTEYESFGVDTQSDLEQLRKLYE